MDVGYTVGTRYRLEERLGTGGMSVVWRAHDTLLGRRVAVKILANPSATRREFRDSIRTDARAAAGLSHPNVANVFDYGEYVNESGQTVPYVVMELLRGQLLAEALLEGPLDPPVALRVCAQVAGALAATHERGLVHRDVKPSNVILTSGGAKLFDFGIAAWVGQLDDADPGAPLLGTAAYLAPERLAGVPATTASDVYALALLLFRALTNALPWSAQTVTGMIAAHVYVEPGPLPRLDGVSQSVRELAQRCLAKDPADRPSARDAAIVLAAAARIAPALLGEGEHGEPLASVVAVSPVRLRRLRRMVGVSAIVSLLTAIILFVPRSGDGSGRPESPYAAAAPDASTATSHQQPTAGPAASAAIGSTLGSGGSTRPGSQPSATGQPAQPIATPTPTQGSATPTEQTISSSGGSVVATCQGAEAFLVSWSPEPGYRVQKLDRGPGSTASVVFRMMNTTVTVAVSCPDGVLTPTVTTR